MAVGIEIGPEAVYAVRLARGRAAPARQAEVPLVRAPRDFSPGCGLREALRNAARSVGVGLSRVAVTANLSTVVARVRLPFDDPDRIDEVIGFHVEERLPFDVDEWVVDYEITARREGEVELLAFAARRDEVAQLLETCAEAGVYPRTVLPRAEALLHLVNAAEAHAPVAALWLDEACADFVVGSEGRLRFARAVPPAGGQDASAPDVPAAVRVCLWSAGVPAEECSVYVGGEGEAAEQALAELRAELPAPVHPAADALASEGSSAAELGPFGLAAGAALSLQGGAVPDLARTVRRPATAAKAMAGPLTAFLAVLLLAGLLFAGHHYRRSAHAAHTEQANRQALHAMWEALYPGEPMPPDPLLRVRSDLAGVQRQDEGPGAVRAVEPLAVLERTVRALPEVEGMEIHEFSIRSGSLVLECRAGSLGAADRVVDALQTELGVSATAANPESLGGGQYRFRIRMQWEDDGALR